MWAKQFIRFHNLQHPKTMGNFHVKQFLDHLALERNVAPATQNQALNALNFLYREVLNQPLEKLTGLQKAKKAQKLPVVLTPEEIRRFFRELEPPYWLLAALMYGSGLRLMESLRIRIKDIDFQYSAIAVRGGKGAKDRIVTLPDEVTKAIQLRIEQTRFIHNKDLQDGFGSVEMPYSLAKKWPNAPKEFAWQYLTPSSTRSQHPRTQQTGRLPYVKTLICNAFTRERRRYQNRAGAASAVMCALLRFIHMY